MAIAAAGIFVLMQVSRTLHHASFLCWFNMASITISVLIALIYMMVEGRDENVVTYAVNPDLTVQSFFGAMSRFVFAYSGQFMYLELMSEMKRPQVSIPATPCLLARTHMRAHPYVHAKTSQEVPRARVELKPPRVSIRDSCTNFNRLLAFTNMHVRTRACSRLLAGIQVHAYMCMLVLL